MQKLVIQSQFMGVKPCEIEIRKFLLLIGEQASGKSTIAKLIYFFQTLPDAVYQNVLLALARDEDFDFTRHISFIVRDKFYETFGSTFHHVSNFAITFYYSERASIKVYRKADRKAYSDFSTELAQHMHSEISSYFRFRTRILNERTDEIIAREELRNTLNEIFYRTNTDYNFIIAGRSTTVGFPEFIEGKIKYELERILEDEVKQQDFEKKRRVGNEMLLLNFVQWAEGVRTFFKKNGGSFEAVISELGNVPTLEKLTVISNLILKGSYDNDAFGELIRISSNQRVYLKDASSGQQEVLRILQGLFLSIGLRNRKEFLIIEEPEAHLFPLAQRELINAFALFLNTIPEGRLIITTHSPYILACVNLLLMAGYTSRQNGEVLRKRVGEAVPQGFWLNSDHLNAYALGGEEEYRLNIKDEVTGLISENYLDNISEHLGMQFHQLYDLLTQPA